MPSSAPADSGSSASSLEAAAFRSLEPEGALGKFGIWEARGSRACKKNPGELDSALQFRAIIVPVKVQIFGQIYSIRGELEVKYVQRLAKFVDEKMHAIAESTGIVDTQKLAVLAALAIADELHSLKTEVTDEEHMLREQAERCLTLVERALKQTA